MTKAMVRFCCKLISLSSLLRLSSVGDPQEGFTKRTSDLSFWVVFGVPVFLDSAISPPILTSYSSHTEA